MNLQAVYKLSLVLTKSQIRGTQRNKFLARLLGEPRIILPIDFALLIGLGAIGYVVMIGSAGATLRPILNPLIPEALAGIPAAIMFTAILFGVLYEISQPIQSLSTDLVNWLPVTSLEYVAGSTVSEAYIYSFMLCLLLGATLGPSVALGATSAWLASACMSTLALFLGAFVVEILDSTTNRISSSFYKKSGRSGIVFRLIATVILFVFIQLLFSGYIVGYLLQSVIRAALFAWFLPVVWPTLAVLSVSQGNVANFLFFAGLSAFFAGTLFVLAGRLREQFWVPVPVSIRLTTGPYHPGRFHLPLVGAAESALIQKDLRSLVRRREMARFLAIPFVIAISMGISLVPLGSQPTPEGPDFITIAFLYVIPITIFVGALSMTSIGQEGNAVWNIYSAPIKPSQLLWAKAFFAIMLGLGFGVALLVVFSFLTRAVAANFGMLLTFGILAVLEVSTLGLYFAARFPDFREMVRSRYVGVWGSVVGLGSELGMASLTIAPSLVSVYLYGSIAPEVPTATVAIGLCVFALACKLAHRQIKHLLQNITT